MRAGRPRQRVFTHRVSIEGVYLWLLVARIVMPLVLLGVVLYLCSDVLSDVRQVVPIVMGKVARWAQR